MVWDLARRFDGVAVSSNYRGNKCCLITITTVWNISIMAAI